MTDPINIHQNRRRLGAQSMVLLGRLGLGLGLGIGLGLEFMVYFDGY